jgi:HSP20 family protein
MYNKQLNASFGPAFETKQHHRGHAFMQSHFRAPVNIYKTENSYELLVFAPGRVKENFSVKTKGNELTVSYTPPEGLPTPEWIKREYSRGAFERTFTIDESIDTTNIQANYTDGVLQVSLPLIPGKEAPQQDIPVN